MVIHESAREMFEIGGISEAEMRKFDKLCLVKESRLNSRVKFFEVKPDPAEPEHLSALIPGQGGKKSSPP